jgi:hypothetical protein
VAGLPEELRIAIGSDKLWNDADHQAVIGACKRALESFSPKSDKAAKP